jgi:hypothetical protein
VRREVKSKWTSGALFSIGTHSGIVKGGNVGMKSASE